MMKRNSKLDFYKGVLMWGVIYGHSITALQVNCGTYVPFLTTIFRTYDMPFFMVISGFLLHNSIIYNTISELIKKRLYSLVLPLFSWIIVLGILKEGMIFYDIKQATVYSLWFIWCVLFCTFVTIVLYAVSGMRNSLFIIGAGLITFFFHVTDFSLYNIGYMFPFFVAGYEIKNYPRIVVFMRSKQFR